MFLGLDLTPIEWVRLAISVFFIAFMVFAAFIMRRNSTNMQDLLRQGQEDKRAREQAVTDLMETASMLAEKTQHAVDVQDKQAEEIVKKIDQNTELTIRAAEASATAAEVANAVNKKIADTNERISEALHQKGQT